MIVNQHNPQTAYLMQPFIPDRCPSCKDIRCRVHACLNIGCETCSAITHFDHPSITDVYAEHYLEWYNNLVFAALTRGDKDVISDAFDFTDKPATSADSCENAVAEFDESYDFDEAYDPDEAALAMDRLALADDWRVNASKYKAAAAKYQAALNERDAAK